MSSGCQSFIAAPCHSSIGHAKRPSQKQRSWKSDLCFCAYILWDAVSKCKQLSFNFGQDIALLEHNYKYFLSTEWMVFLKSKVLPKSLMLTKSYELTPQNLLIPFFQSFRYSSMCSLNCSSFFEQNSRLHLSFDSKVNTRPNYAHSWAQQSWRLSIVVLLLFFWMFHVS